MKEVVENVLGTDYIVRLGEREELSLSQEYTGECLLFDKKIKVLHSYKTLEERDLLEYEKEVRTKEIVVHEVCHAFLNESGVALDGEVEEQVCNFLMKNFFKMSNVILDVLDKNDLLDC